MPGFLGVLLAKLAGLGTVAKVAVAATTTALTMALGAGTGVLPVPGSQAEPAALAQGAVDHATAPVGAAVKSLLTTAPGGTGAEASVTSPAGSASARSVV